MEAIFDTAELDVIRAELASLQHLLQYLIAWRNDHFESQTFGKKMTMHISLMLKMENLVDEVEWSRLVLGPARSRLNPDDGLRQMLDNGLVQAKECDEMTIQFSQLSNAWVISLSAQTGAYVERQYDLAEQNTIDAETATRAASP